MIKFMSSPFHTLIRPYEHKCKLSLSLKEHGSTHRGEKGKLKFLFFVFCFLKKEEGEIFRFFAVDISF
jgi:hypothetical protein